VDCIDERIPADSGREDGPGIGFGQRVRAEGELLEKTESRA
jgi:hypothetical protein